ncbi:hypothetical protein C1645_804766 [Glomus cerebriforme]|uniref:F-box domain-containing protein n=1 Tax=Glomus cerebriforme TaxID=658196 RepID=A0A397T146_9GLOM|nr:hypothetical protein C1645_804766 [Glomus cerebriforme]
MYRQINDDCLTMIFENFKEDKNNLYRCLLVNRDWCRISVKFLWGNVWDAISTPYEPYKKYKSDMSKVSSHILRTLISCLPNESKYLLYKNGIISTSTSSPLFNYASFCKVLSFNEIRIIIDIYLNNIQPTSEENINLVSREILNMFMNQLSLKELSLIYNKYYHEKSYNKILKNQMNMSFVDFPGAKDYLKSLSKLTCYNVALCKLPQICHNIQSLNIIFEYDVYSEELVNLISSQKSIKSLSLKFNGSNNHWEEFTLSLKKHSNTLTKLNINWKDNHWPLSFIKDFKNLEELELSLSYTDKECPYSDYLMDLEDFIFPRLRILKFVDFPEVGIMIKFIENNGKNLKEFYAINDDDYEDSYMEIDEIEHSLTKHSDTILRLYLLEPSSLSYIIKFINLQELVIAFFTCPEEFEILQHITFPHLEILKFVKECPKVEMVIKFLENNGKNLKEFCSYRCDNSLSLAIAKCCPNLKFLYVQFMKRETLREIFDNCQQLESIEVWSDEKHLKGKEVLEIVTKHSPKNFHKLRLYESNISELHTKDLESFFIEWNNRLPQKSLSFIIHNVQKDHLIHDDNFEKNNKIKKIIEKYKDLSVIKKFKVIKSYEFDFSIHLPDTLLYSNYYEEGIFCI